MQMIAYFNPLQLMQLSGIGSLDKQEVAPVFWEEGITRCDKKKRAPVKFQTKVTKLWKYGILFFSFITIRTYSKKVFPLMMWLMC